MSDLMSTFGTRLKEVREKRGFTKKEVAEILQVTGRSYQYYEDGQREPGYEKLVALARCLQVSTDYLLGLSDKQ